MILIVKNISIEGPGTLGEFFESKGYQLKTVECDAGEKIPLTLAGIEAIIVLGGPMNVYEEEKFPYLKEEHLLLKRALNEEIPVLGICLGSQLLAKAAGAEVKKANVKEIGWASVDLTEQGKEDFLFKGLGQSLEVFQWHEDTFELPEGSSLLATSEQCLSQAFRLGKCAYGLQFHIEVTDNIIASWIKKYFKVSEIKENTEGKIMIDQYNQMKVGFDCQAERVVNNFIQIMKESRKHLKV